MNNKLSFFLFLNNISIKVVGIHKCLSMLAKVFLESAYKLCFLLLIKMLNFKKVCVNAHAKCLVLYACCVFILS